MSNDNYNVYGSDGPELEPTLLLKYLITRYDELLETDEAKFPLILRGMALASMAHDKEGYAELTNILHPESQMRRCRDILEQALARTKKGQPSDRQDEKCEGKHVSLGERNCRQFLVFSLREGRRMIAAEDYEYAKVLESIGWVALQCYPRRLSEFENAWQSFDDDPAKATLSAVDVLRTAFSLRDRE